MIRDVPLVTINPVRPSSEPDTVPSAFINNPDHIDLIACSVAEDRRWSGSVVQNHCEFEQCLKDLQTIRRHESRVFMLPLQHSRARLNITAAQFERLLASMNAFTGVNKMIESFVSDATDFYLGRGSVHFSPATLRPQTSSLPLEFCALLKFVEPNDRKGWSIRQMGFYHTYSRDTESESTLLVNASSLAWTTLRTHLSKGAQTWRHWSMLPLLIFETLSSEWTSYIRSLHQQVFQMHQNVAFLQTPEEDEVKKGITSYQLVSIEEIKRISFYKDALKHAEHALTTNLETLEEYLREAERRYKHENNREDEYQALCFGVKSVMRELRFEKRQTELILFRLEQIAASYHDVASTVNSDRMAEMTVKSIKEAHAVRIIALVTFCFLPPTFTCAFLQLNYIQFEGFSDGLLTVTADGAALVFWLALTAPLLALTIGSWFLWDRRLRKHQQALVLDGHQRGLV